MHAVSSALVALAWSVAGAADVDLRTSIHSMAQTETRATATVKVVNPGPGTARSVVVSVELPDGARAVVHEPECTATGAASFDCTVREVPPGDYEARFTWDRSGTGEQILTATARSAGTDPRPGNNSATFNFSSPAPVFGTAVRVGRISGVVAVRERGHRSFTRLTGTSVIPVGSEVDTSRGRVRLISAVDEDDGTQSAEFYEGRFVVTQGRRRGGLTRLRLSGPRPACGSPARSSARRRLRLWGHAKGRFRTIGRHGASSVRGTRWLTEERCSGTYVRVVEGRVDVRDFGRDRTVRVRAGESYLARARR